MVTTPNDILLKYWNYSSFRSPQEKIIESILAGKDTLAILPTGAGKSICYQVPALCKEGICIVISPLIALMKDQKDQLVKRGIKAEVLHTGMHPNEMERIFDNCIYGNVKFLYVSPERIQTPFFRLKFEKMKVSLIAVDEAHCISQWGYNFRPEYLKIPVIRDMKLGVPILAVTATATLEVADDIAEKLTFKKFNIFRGDMKRPELGFIVRTTENKRNMLVHILQKTPGCGIVYAATRREVNELTLFLQAENISANAYHAGLPQETRMERQNAWIKGEIRIIVCTNAFGMGIDKPDVRTVIHLEMPVTPESYYQEAGRAGRDRKKCYSVILFHTSDLEKIEVRIQNRYPEFKQVREIYDKLGNYCGLSTGEGEYNTYNFDLENFCHAFKSNPVETQASIYILEQHGYILRSEGMFEPSKIQITEPPENIYALRVANRNFDLILQVLIRSYAGIFDQPVIIREEELARRTGLSVQNIKILLKNLHSSGIIIYTERSGDPKIEWLQPRIHKNNLVFDVGKIKKLRENDIKRFHFMKNYVLNNTICRSVIIRSYFDDHNNEPCGICDVCISKRKIIPEERLMWIEKKILKLLASEGLEPAQLSVQLSNIPKEELMEVVRIMLENGYLKTEHGIIKLI